MSYTGILGDGVLGEFSLGETVLFVGLAATQQVAEIIYLATPKVRTTQHIVEITYAGDPNLDLTQYVIELIYVRPPAFRLSTIIVEALVAETPSLRLTQNAVEALVQESVLFHDSQLVVEAATTYAPLGRITQDVCEVLYQNTATNTHYYTHTGVATSTVERSSILNKAITSAITVASMVGGSYTLKTLTSSGTATQTIGALKSVYHQTVTSTGTAAQTIFITGVDRLESVSSTGTAAQTIGIYLPYNHQSVQSDVSAIQTIRMDGISVELTVTSSGTATQTIFQERLGVHELSVQSDVGVDQTIGYRSNVIRISLTSEIGATQSADERDTVDRIAVESEVGVTETIFARDGTNRQAVSIIIAATQTLAFHDTHNRQSVESDATVTPIITIFNPNIHVVCPVTVVPTITFITSIVLISVESAASVDSVIDLALNPNRQSVVSAVKVQEFPNPITWYTNPDRVEVTSEATVDCTITGGNSHRLVAIETTATAAQFIEAVNPNITVVSNAIASQTVFRQGTSYGQSMLATAVVATLVDATTVPLRARFTDRIDVTQTIEIVAPPIVELEVETDLLVTQSYGFTILSPQLVLDPVTVDSIILERASPCRQSVLSEITVSPHLHWSPVVLEVESEVTVSTSARRLEFAIQSNLNVAHLVSMIRTRFLVQQAPVTQTLEANRVLIREIRSQVHVAQTVRKNGIWSRNLTSYVPIFESLRPIQSGFGDILEIPVAIGVIVANNMILSGAFGTIILPAAQLGDSESQVNEISVRRSMNGATYSYIQGTPRRKLSYDILVDHLKGMELRSWIGRNLSELITLKNWKGEIWKVKLTKNPFELTNDRKWQGPANEAVTVTLELEGVKIT